MATGEGFAGWAKKAWKEGRFADCADFYRRSAEVYDANGDFMKGGSCSRHQAEALLKAGDAAGASGCIFEVVRFYRGQEVGGWRWQMLCGWLGLQQRLVARTKEAAEFWGEAREG